MAFVVSKETRQRIGRVEESSNELEERQCIETFLNWCDRRFRISFSYQRTEDIFPDLANSTRWDFIIRQDQCSHWYAAEIKRLIKPEVKIKLVQWNGFLRRISNSLGDRLNGEFLIYGAPSLQLDKQQRTELRRVLTKIIEQNSTRLKKDGMVDLGSQILGQFKEWPSTPRFNPNLSPPIEHRVNADSCFTLHRLSDTGCSLELGFAQSGAFLIEQVAVEALTSLFDNGEVLQAHGQLGLAKQNGAKGAILLLDYHLPSWYPNKVTRTLANNMDSKQLSTIDAVYLVKVSQNRVSKVWARNSEA